MDNYIVINGKKAELTEKQLIALGIETKNNDPFKLRETEYYWINGLGAVLSDFYSNGCGVSEDRHNVANFCTDKKIMEQRALHETLNRLLWRYSMRHDGDKIDWHDANSSKFKIYYNTYENSLNIDGNQFYVAEGAVYFYTKEIAVAAIKEIVNPFMEEHPDFKW